MCTVLSAAGPSPAFRAAILRQLTGKLLLNQVFLAWVAAKAVAKVPFARGQEPEGPMADRARFMLEPLFARLHPLLRLGDAQK
jgi:hypothetical protein